MTRREAEQQLAALKAQLEDLRFATAISGMPFQQQQALRSERASPEERKNRQAAFALRLQRYEEQTAETRRAIAEWDARYGGNPAEYATRLRIVEHLRADAEAYAHGNFRVPLGRLLWRILPPGPWGGHELAAIHAAVRGRNPGVQLDESRLPYADSLGPVKKYIGEDEFDGYFVFLFERTDRVLLENPIEGNAAYIFHGDWTYLSKLSKHDLLTIYGDSVKRVLHREAGDWRGRIKRSLRLR